jgi:hypothetical protein
LARRSIHDPTPMAYYVGSRPPDTSLQKIVQVVGTRWAVEESFETAKGAVGLEHDEARSWCRWYRHITLALFAHAYLTVLRAQAGGLQEVTQKKRGDNRDVRRGRGVDSPDGARSAAPTLAAGVGHLLTPDQVCHWSRWRRHHQAVAKNYHYKQQSAPSMHRQL